jgi:hypothetical protein
MVIKIRPYATDFIDTISSPASSGIGIPFDYEFPWVDFGARTNTKTSKYIASIHEVDQSLHARCM